MSEISSTSELTTKEIVEQAIQDYHATILPYLKCGNGGYSDTPIGAVTFFNDTEAPNGWLACDGSIYNISDYPYLAAHYERVYGSKNHYGGDGITTFAVQNDQGEFLRGAGTNSHANQGSGGEVGEHQDATQHHDGLFITSTSEDRLFMYYSSSGSIIINGDSAIGTGSRRKGFGNINNWDETFSGYEYQTSRPTSTSYLICVKAVPAAFMNKPNLWEVGTEYDFGNNVYGQRFTGTVTANANVRSVITIGNIPNINWVINYGGGWSDRTSVTSAIGTIPNVTPTSDNRMVEDSAFVNADSDGNISFWSMSDEARNNSPFNVWILYTKTTD